MLRIISGKYKGQKISSPISDDTRSTTDRVREAVFDIIQFNIKNSIVLDLFAGSGAYAIEAISRGATKAIINDISLMNITYIKDNLDKLKIKNYDLLHYDYEKLLHKKEGAKFDLIFLDPPYAKIDLYNKSLSLIASLDLLSQNGYIILEKNTSTHLVMPDGLIINVEKNYGTKTILIINKI